MSKDKNVGVPIIGKGKRIAKFTKSQKELWTMIQADLTSIQQALSGVLNMIQGKLVNPLLLSILERFADELELDTENENWEFEAEKFRFVKKPVTAKVGPESDSKPQPK